jgi:hypothetical protein
MFQALEESALLSLAAACIGFEVGAQGRVFYDVSEQGCFMMYFHFAE